MDLVAQRPPASHRSFEMESLDGLDAAIERAPRHDLGVCELLALTADLPDPVVRLLPMRLEEFEQDALKRPRIGVLLEAR